MFGRRYLLVVGIVSLLAAAGGAVWFERPTAGEVSLSTVDDSYRICYQPDVGSDWSSLVRSGRNFGVDYLHLSSPSGRVTVTAASLIAPRGGMRLTRVMFFPSGSIGPGSAGDQPIESSIPVVSRMGRTLPARIEQVTTPAGAGPDFDGDRWQLVIAVQASPSATTASLEGVLLTYKSGSVTRTLRTRDSVIWGTGKDVCKH
jgi:hypothetical protein